MAFEHTLLVADLVVDLELDRRVVLGEVAVRRQRINGCPEACKALSPEQASVIEYCRRIPDAIELRSDGTLVAYEIELASKGRSRREAILATYAASDYAAVEWIVPEGQLARLLRHEIHDMGLHDFMRITHGRRIEMPTLLERAQRLQGVGL